MNGEGRIIDRTTLPTQLKVDRQHTQAGTWDILIRYKETFSTKPGKIKHWNMVLRG